MGGNLMDVSVAQRSPFHARVHRGQEIVGHHAFLVPPSCTLIRAWSAAFCTYPTLSPSQNALWSSLSVEAVLVRTARDNAMKFIAAVHVLPPPYATSLRDLHVRAVRLRMHTTCTHQPNEIPGGFLGQNKSRQKRSRGYCCCRCHPRLLLLSLLLLPLLLAFAAAIVTAAATCRSMRAVCAGPWRYAACHIPHSMQFVAFCPPCARKAGRLTGPIMRASQIIYLKFRLQSQAVFNSSGQLKHTHNAICIRKKNIICIVHMHCAEMLSMPKGLFQNHVRFYP